MAAPIDVDSVIILGAESAAHHARGAHTEQVVHSVKGQQQGAGKSERGVLEGNVQQAHKLCISQVVD